MTNYQSSQDFFSELIEAKAKKMAYEMRIESVAIGISAYSDRAIQINVNAAYRVKLDTDNHDSLPNQRQP